MLLAVFVEAQQHSTGYVAPKIHTVICMENNSCIKTQYEIELLVPFGCLLQHVNIPIALVQLTPVVCLCLSEFENYITLEKFTRKAKAKAQYSNMKH